MRATRWSVRALVILTALVCLGVGGYAGQVWAAKRAAGRILIEMIPHADGDVPITAWGSIEDLIPVKGRGPGWTGWWRSRPWFGEWEGGSCGLCWVPRRTYYELCKLATGEDRGNDPDAWETWFKAHPGLAWDPELKRLAARP